MATKVNMGTKKADELIHDFNHTHYKGKTLYEVYGTVSQKKRDSWQQICSDCTYLLGWNLHITGASCYNYSCMYAFKNEDGNIILRKETKGGTYDLEMTPEQYKEYITV